MRVACKLGTVGLALVLGLVFGCKSEPAPEQTEKKVEQKAPPAAEQKAAEEPKAQPKETPKEEPKQAETPKQEPQAPAAPSQPAAPTANAPAASGVPLAADVLPANTAAVFGTLAISEWVKILAAVGVTTERLLASDAEFQEALDLLGVNPLTEEGLVSLGIDTSRSPLLAFVPGTQVEALGIMALPMMPGKSGIALLKDLLAKRKAEDKDKVKAEEGKHGDVPILWMTKQSDGDLAAVMDMSGYWFLIFVSEGHASQEAEAEEVRGLATRIAEPSTSRMSSTPGFKETVAGMEGSIIQIYATFQGLLPLMLKDREGALFASWLGNYTGAALWVKEEGNSANLVVRTYGNQPSGMFRDRDIELAKLVPVEPLLGFHMALNAAKAVELLERGLANDKSMTREFQEGWGELLSKLGLPAGTRIDELWNGEFGFFMGMITKDPGQIVRSLAGFVGVADETRVRTAIDAVIAKEDKAKSIIRETVGDVPVWRLRIEGMDMAVVVTGGRLWYLGDANQAAALVKGEAGKLTASERGTKMAGVMSLRSSSVAFADLQKIMLMALPLLSSGDREDLMEAMPLITALDNATFSLEEAGVVDTGTLAVSMTAPVRETVIKLVQQLVAKEFEKAALKKAEPARGPQENVKVEPPVPTQAPTVPAPAPVPVK